MIVDSYVIFGFNATDTTTLGLLSFRVGSDYPTVISYSALVYTQATVPVLTTTIPLGKPTPNEAGIITVNIRAQLNALTAGNYTVVITSTDAGGTTVWPGSNDFTVPLF